MFFEAQGSLCKAQRCMKKYVDQHRDSLEFTVGDKVLLKLNLTIDCVDDPNRNRSKRDPSSIPTEFDAEIEKILDHWILGTNKITRKLSS